MHQFKCECRFLIEQYRIKYQRLEAGRFNGYPEYAVGFCNDKHLAQRFIRTILSKDLLFLLVGKTDFDIVDYIVFFIGYVNIINR